MSMQRGLANQARYLGKHKHQVGMSVTQKSGMSRASSYPRGAAASPYSRDMVGIGGLSVRG